MISFKFDVVDPFTVAVKRKSWQQSERQNTRAASGRFSSMNPCNGCGKSAGADYLTDDRSDTHGGFGLCLCGRCAKRLGEMTDAEFAKAAAAARGAS